MSSSSKKSKKSADEDSEPPPLTSEKPPKRVKKVKASETKKAVEDPYKGTSPCMTMYEYTTVLALRARQLYEPKITPLVETEEGEEPMVIAKREIALRLLSFDISRSLNSGEKVVVRSIDLILPKE